MYIGVGGAPPLPRSPPRCLAVHQERHHTMARARAGQLLSMFPSVSTQTSGEVPHHTGPTRANSGSGDADTAVADAGGMERGAPTAGTASAPSPSSSLPSSCVSSARGSRASSQHQLHAQPQALASNTRLLRAVNEQGRYAFDGAVGGGSGDDDDEDEPLYTY